MIEERHTQHAVFLVVARWWGWRRRRGFTIARDSYGGRGGLGLRRRDIAAMGVGIAETALTPLLAGVRRRRVKRIAPVFGMRRFVTAAFRRGRTGRRRPSLLIFVHREYDFACCPLTVGGTGFRQRPGWLRDGGMACIARLLGARNGSVFDFVGDGWLSVLSCGSAGGGWV